MTLQIIMKRDGNVSEKIEFTRIFINFDYPKTISRKNLRTREFLLKLLTKTNKFNTNIDRTITNIEFDTGILVIQKIVNSTSY